MKTLVQLTTTVRVRVIEVSLATTQNSLSSEIRTFSCDREETFVWKLKIFHAGLWQLAHPALYKLFSLLLVLLSAQHRRVSTVVESVDSLGLGLSGGEHCGREDLLHYWWQSVGIKTEERSTRRHLFHHSVHTHHTQINSQRQPESLQTQSTHSHCSRLYCQR